MQTISYKDLIWIDILNPTKEDLNFLKENFDFDPLLISEIKTPTYHPVLESYDTYLFWILHFPDFDKKINQITSVEIDFFITKKGLVTVRYQKFDEFYEVFKVIKEDAGKYMERTTGHLFYYIVKNLLNYTLPEIDRIKNNIDRTESEIFGEFNEKIIEDISVIKREILRFVRAIKPQQTIWLTAPKHAQSFWGDKLRPYFNDLRADYDRIYHIVETHRDIIDSLHFTSNSLLDNKRNNVIKILTIFTAVLLPLTLFTSIYGMNLAYLPLAGRQSTFWLFSILMAGVIAFLLLYFKIKKWL